jgi:hypothetical protein
MTIKITDIEYDLYDEETNPNNEITPEDFELPPNLVIEQKAIDELYGEGFDLNSDLADLITCHTGFGVTGFKHEVIS